MSELRDRRSSRSSDDDLDKMVESAHSKKHGCKSKYYGMSITVIFGIAIAVIAYFLMVNQTISKPFQRTVSKITNVVGFKTFDEEKNINTTGGDLLTVLLLGAVGTFLFSTYGKYCLRSKHHAEKAKEKHSGKADFSN